MISSLIRQTIVAHRSYAAVDIDRPGGARLAFAWQAVDGWRVGTPDGRTVAEKLTETRALNVMHETASRHLDRAATRSLREATR